MQKTWEMTKNLAQKFSSHFQYHLPPVLLKDWEGQIIAYTTIFKADSPSDQYLQSLHYFHYFQMIQNDICHSAGNRGNFAARLLGKIAERLIDYNRLFGSLPEVIINKNNEHKSRN